MVIADPGRRRVLGGAYAEEMDRPAAREYDSLRPRYPGTAVEEVLGAANVGRAPLRIADLGAGTGILTRQLLDVGADRVGQVHAVEPSHVMTQVLAETLDDGDQTSGGQTSDGEGAGAAGSRLQIHLTTAEDTGLPEDGVDVVVVAQAWHWFEVAAVQREAHRILAAGGAMAILSNHLDTADPWVHRLTRIMRAGDVHRPGWVPPMNPRLFAEPRTEEFTWSRRLTADQVRGLATTMSSWLSAGEKERARRRANLDWYLQEHSGLAGGDLVELPYLTVLHTAARR
ncbi:methyltransferase domain-containing protein [Nesterenkonia xinjiangensis]|uniref:SAM-dependent methyltransferase n=1 Tax=Nesterenkonia xinjiangensis TaxID=225327 RepID=A0A7Z0K9U9_9MICC|nr:SAM-dependent methyltransferase [Nesterenkonia xinjiangensis]